MYKISKITSEKPRHLAKSFRLKADELIKGTSAALRRGRIEVVQFDKFKDFTEVLQALTPSNALLFGVPENPEAQLIVTQRMLLENPVDKGAIARTNNHFVWPEGPGVMMMDYDPAPGSLPLSRGDLLKTLVDAVPELADIQLIWCPSSSSNVCKVGGEDLTGLRGQRIYIPVADARDIPRAGSVLQERLWLADGGRIQVSKSGGMLERTQFDASVWQPSRLDFAGGVITCRALEQRREAPLLIHAAGRESAETHLLLPDLDDANKAAVSQIKEIKKAQARPLAIETREAWLSGRRKDALNSISSTAPAESVETLNKALDTKTLARDFVVFVQDPEDRDFHPVTVGNICKDRLKYDGRITLDPIEPDYNNHAAVGKLFLSGRSQCLHSFAHGGTPYKLETETIEIIVNPGKTNHATHELLEFMRNDSRFFDYGDDLVTIVNNQIHSLDEYSLELTLSQDIQFLKGVKDGVSPIDPPRRLLCQALSLRKARGLKPLRGLLNVPSVRADGSLLKASGYDPQSQLYLTAEVETFPDIPNQPSRADALEALETIWAPFSEFPFVDDASRGAMLAGILTCVIRPSLPKAPMFHSDAPTVGAGKTLLLEALGLLATGQPVSMMPPPRAGDSSEMRKLITSAAMPGNKGVMLLDNCVGQFSSGPLSAFLTSEVWEDRLLGTNSLAGGLPTRLFTAVSGSNLTFSDELNRRVIQWRIDPEKEVAFDREFDFCPKELIKKQRPQIITAAITLILIALEANLPKPKGRLASYEVWDKIVRQTVRYIAIDLQPGLYADPVDQLRERALTDHDAADLNSALRALKRCFGNDWFKAREVSERVNALGSDPDLAEAFSDIARKNSEISAKSIGRHMTSMLDRRSGNLVLRSKSSRQMRDWRVEVIAPEKD